MIEFKVATLMLRQALTEGLPTDKALARLQLYKTTFPSSWQITHVMPLIAQIQMDAKDYKGAEATFQEMADMEFLPADVRVNAELDAVPVPTNGSPRSRRKQPGTRPLPRASR
jgi:hypothetical protein